MSKFICVVVVLVMHLSLGGTAAQAQVMVYRSKKIGDKPELSFTTSDGGKFGLNDLRGKIVVVYFWQVGSKDEVEAKHLVDLYEKLQPKGLELIGLGLGERFEIKVQGEVDPTKQFKWPHVNVGSFAPFAGPENQFGGGQPLPWAAIVSPDGVLLWTGGLATLDKPLEAAFKQFPPKLLDPKILAAATQALDAAAVSLKVGKTLDAIQAISRVPEEAKSEYRIKVQTRKLSKAVDSAAYDLMKSIDGLVEAKQYGQAWTQLTAIIKAVPDSDIAPQAKTKLEALLRRSDAKAAIEKQKREETAAAELDTAQRLQSDRKDREACAKFRYIARTYADTPAGATAAAAVAAYEKDPAFAKSAATTAPADGKARGLLSMAASYAQSGQTDLARKKYQEVIDQFPGTGFAETAKAELAKLK